MLTIHCPEIVESGDSVRLQAVFDCGDVHDTLWFSTTKEYGKYLCHERGDAFLVAMLLYAVNHNEDITLEVPVSERLYYTLSRHFTQALTTLFPGSRKVKIICDIASTPLSSEKAVGTGLSCGIDSFCTVTEHMDDACPPNYRLTHLTFFNVGASGDYGGDYARELFHKRINAVKPCADELGLPLVTLDSNISEILDMNFVPSHTYRNVAGVLALQKLFSIYYYSSGYSLMQFACDSSDTSHYDVYLLDMLSTENTKFYSSGEVYSRVEKTDIVAKNPLSYKYLNVCVTAETNCSRCHKCQRTLTTLDILGKLKLYDNVFDLTDYIDQRWKYFGNILLKHKTDLMLAEIYDVMPKYKYPTPIKSYLYVIIYKPIKLILKLGAKHSPEFVKKIYRAVRSK